MGFERQLAKAERRLAPFLPAYRGVDLDGVLAQVRAAAADGSLEPPPIRI